MNVHIQYFTQEDLLYQYQIAALLMYHIYSTNKISSCIVILVHGAILEQLLLILCATFPIIFSKPQGLLGILPVAKSDRHQSLPIAKSDRHQSLPVAKSDRHQSLPVAKSDRHQSLPVAKSDRPQLPTLLLEPVMQSVSRQAWLGTLSLYITRGPLTDHCQARWAPHA
jgi:hypothetical protein